MVSFPQVSPPKLCLHLSSPPYVLTIPDTHFVRECESSIASLELMKEKNFSTSPRDKNPIPGRPAHSNYYALLITPATKNSGQFHSEALDGWKYFCSRHRPLRFWFISVLLYVQNELWANCRSEKTSVLNAKMTSHLHRVLRHDPPRNSFMILLLHKGKSGHVYIKNFSGLIPKCSVDGSPPLRLA